MPYRIAINGFGRIGRCVLRALYESRLQDSRNGDAQDPRDFRDLRDLRNLQVVAINELTDIASLTHLTRYDSTHGRFPGIVGASAAGSLIVNEDEIQVFGRPKISDLPWRDLGIDLVMECTGSFSDRATATEHLQSGAGRVLFSQPAQSDVDATIIYGVNHDTLRVEDRIISAASCSTNCIAPVIKCLDDNFGIENGVITTIHSAMNDQPVIDAYHHSDLRKTRSAMQSIIPVTTELSKGIGRIFPHLDGRFEAQALRVPTVNVSAIDMAVTVNKDTSTGEVNEAIRAAAKQSLPGVLACTDEPLASCDFNHDPRSAIVDIGQSKVAGSRLIKVLTWFDNEWAYANRMLDVADLIRQLRP